MVREAFNGVRSLQADNVKHHAAGNAYRIARNQLKPYERRSES